jgi:Family of unknown function (DUF6011)
MTPDTSTLFEKLRLQAESDTVNAGTDKRRPSWGPALVLGDEILTALADLNHSIPDKKVARLWATFRGPDKVTTYLRNDVSRLPMPEARVRAFELRLGTDRSGERLLQAKRDSTGLWSVNTYIRSRFPRWQEFYRANNQAYVRRRAEQYRQWINGSNIEQPALIDELAKAEAELALYAEVQEAHAAYGRQQQAFGELVKQRVAEFAGDPFAQMIAGAHVTGNCCICGRSLTDPLSLERGIGPECYGHVAPGLRAHVEQQEHAA